MDPNTAVMDILTCLEEGDYDQAQQTAAGLKHWLNTGGFMPDFNKLSDRHKLKVWQMFVMGI